MGFLNIAKRSIHAQDGIAMPVALMSIVSVMLLIGGVATNASWSQHQTRRDTGSKQALDAAEAGIHTAIGRLNRLHPKPNRCVVETPHVQTSPTASATTWCPSQTVTFDDDESVAFRVTAGTNDNQHGIVAIGMSQCDLGLADTSSLCVKRRLAVTVTNTPASFETDVAAFSSGDVWLNNDRNVVEGVSNTPADPANPPCPVVGGAIGPSPTTYCGARVKAGGNVRVGGRDGVCGQLTLRNGADYRVTGNHANVQCLGNPIKSTAPNLGLPGGGPSTSATSSPYKDPQTPVAPAPVYSTLVRDDSAIPTPPDVMLPDNVVANSANCRLTTLRPLKPGLTPNPNPCANTGEPDLWPSPAPTSSWDADKKSLIVKGDDTVTLRGGVYFFCYLEVGNGELRIDTDNPNPNDPTLIYIGAPGTGASTDLCPTNDDPPPAPGKSWGSVDITGNIGITNIAPNPASPATFPGNYINGNPGKLQILAVGGPGPSDKIAFPDKAGHQRLIVYAPHSTVEVLQSSGVSRVVGDNLVIGGNFGIEWDDRAAVAIHFEPTQFERTAWYECPSQLPSGSPFTASTVDPTSGCNQS